MSLWRRTPRQVYEVYGEDEYLSEDGARANRGAPTVEAGMDASDDGGYEGEPHHLGGDPARVSPAAVPTGAWEHPHAPPPGRLLGLALLAAVTLAAGVLVAFHALHRPAATHPVGARNAPTGKRSRAPQSAPLPPPPKVPAPSYSRRRARAHTLPAARPPRHGRRLARGHEQIPTTLTQARLDVQPAQPSAAAWPGSEFNFER